MYYITPGYIGSDSEATFISLVIIVASILEIILFFKVWGMTNNVANIKAAYLDTKKVDMNPTAEYFAIKALKGKDAAKDFLTEHLICFIRDKYNGDLSMKIVDELQNMIKAKYFFLMQDAGIEEMDFADAKSFFLNKSQLLPEGIILGEDVKYLDEGGFTWRGKLISYDNVTEIAEVMNAHGEKLKISTKKIKSVID